MHLRSPVRLRPCHPYSGATLLPFGWQPPASLAKGEPAALYPARNERAKAGDETRTRDIFLGKENSTFVDQLKHLIDGHCTKMTYQDLIFSIPQETRNTGASASPRRRHNPSLALAEAACPAEQKECHTRRQGFAKRLSCYPADLQSRL